MANLLPGLIGLVINLIIMTAITLVSLIYLSPGMACKWLKVTLSPPDDAKIASLCSTGWLQCVQSTVVAGQNVGNGVHHDVVVHTIKDLQRDFFLEFALVVGDEMTLNANLRDAAPKRAFMTASAAKSLPTFTFSNTLNLVKHFGVSPNTEMATSIATGAYLCGYGSLPGENMSCVASADAVAKFVSSELGSRVHVLSTSSTPAAAPTVKAPMTIVDVAKGNVAKGNTIIVCHAMNFSLALYYCHRVTGTKVITATLKPAHSNSSNPINAVGMCHIDTSLWLSTHPAFRALDIPRGDEACHWLIDSDMLFYPTAGNAAKLA